MSSQSFSAPIHLSKTHQDGNVLVVQMVNATAGLLEGDRLAIMAKVGPGARLLLTGPSATRALGMGRNGATIVQRFQVGGGAWFENCAPLLIPHASARLLQHTEMNIEDGGEALLIETVAPGRVAAGEVFEYALLDWMTDVRLNGGAIARERYRLGRERPAAWEGPRALFVTPYFGSCFIVSERLTRDEALWKAIHDLHAPDAWVGCSALPKHGASIRIVAANSLALRRVIGAVRLAVYGAKGGVPPRLRGGS